ncbi:MAG: hypothetical protein WAW17_02275 [Rhodococcus sp. (in: high G+C Gram-positive bacteria)]|uniref:hypothetical protein n=1 Tax=Rhodococcus sp. TaxID=1831 RepID=UPI003BB05868
MRASHLPLRLTTGAFILNAGLGKRALPPEAAAALQNMAANVAPVVRTVRPETFGKTLSAAETALGATLLAPFVPSALAGAALVAFSGGLLTMYWKTPGMHENGSIRPTQDGTAVAKDVWMLGIGAALLVDELGRRGPGLSRP